MQADRKGEIAIIFSSCRTDIDEVGYQAAATEMEEMAAAQPGYRGITSTRRGPDGHGITISYWANEDAAKAWRDHPEHARIREMGRARWYKSYSLEVATITRNYGWSKNDG